MSPVISVESLSKSYRLGQIGTGTLTNDLKVWWARRRGQPNPLLKVGQADPAASAETIWALKDVSFTVEQGEVLGIIGRNGAGKSTLLKILSRVTAPTAGLIKVKGRIASLLEVGTGFHPELTGRENIFLNGAILGMNRAEVARKLDEIVAFAEIEKFLDTPVKRYSSGMYVRLAFAVAAHLEPEILLVDEVLAVGDAEFQKKCLGKMGDVAAEGRTVLFVSHNMAAVQSLCRTAILLEKGTPACTGNVETVTRQYLEGKSESQKLLEPNVNKWGFILDKIRVVQGLNTTAKYLLVNQPVIVEINYTISTPISNLLLGFDVFDSSGHHIFRTYDCLDSGLSIRGEGKYISKLTLPAKVFQIGNYYFSLLAGVHRVGWITKDDIRITLEFLEDGKSDIMLSGILQPIGKWNTTQNG